MAENLLHKVLADHPSKFAFFTDHAARFRFQALLSEIKLDASGCPSLVRHGYRVDHEYFYPASAIKLCAPIGAFYKLKDLQQSLGLSVTCTTPLTFYPLLEGEKRVEHDPSNIVCGKITVAHEMRKLFLVSDNVAFNRLYAFTGQRYINETMWQLGLQSTRLQHRLSMPLSKEENKCCEPVELDLGEMIVALPPKKNEYTIPNNSKLASVEVGIAHLSVDGELILQPMDFSEKNYMSLLDLQNLLVKLFCKDIKLDGKPISLYHDMQMMLMEAMSEYPSESCNPLYAKAEYPDDYGKLFLPGLCRVRPKKALRIFNKLGRAYGFTVENAYIFDKETGRGFFLSAVIFTNANGILNDDKYEYEDIADRVMADLAEMVARTVWQIPPSSLRVSSPFDCIPSSLWADGSGPLVPLFSLASEEKDNGNCIFEDVDTQTQGKSLKELEEEDTAFPSFGLNAIKKHGGKGVGQSFEQVGCVFEGTDTWSSMSGSVQQLNSLSLLSLQQPHLKSQMQTCDDQRDILFNTSQSTSFSSVLCMSSIDPLDCGRNEKASIKMNFSPTEESLKVPSCNYSNSSLSIASCYQYFINE